MCVPGGSRLIKIITKAMSFIMKLEYRKNIINSDLDHMVTDYSTWIDEVINGSNESFITEAGDVEKWIGSSKKKLLENKEETIKYLQNLKK